MKARVTVTGGSVRIFPTNKPTLPGSVDAVEAPYTVELDGDWAVGSASVPGEVVLGEFKVEALDEPVRLRVFKATADVYGNAVPSTDSEYETLQPGEESIFDAHDSNAYTVQSASAETAEQTPAGG